MEVEADRISATETASKMTFGTFSVSANVVSAEFRATAVSGTWFQYAAVGRQPYCPMAQTL